MTLRLPQVPEVTSRIHWLQRSMWRRGYYRHLGRVSVTAMCRRRSCICTCRCQTTTPQLIRPSRFPCHVTLGRPISSRVTRLPLATPKIQQRWVDKPQILKMSPTTFIQWRHSIVSYRHFNFHFRYTISISGYMSGARCRLAYGPADATATHCLLLQ